MHYSFGIDIGSTTTELVVTHNETLEIAYKSSTLTGAHITQTGNEMIEKAKAELGISSGPEETGFIVATGYGRKLFEPAQLQKSDTTEITCYARGAIQLNKAIRTIIDIGGQDSKVISLEDNGMVKNFIMNDKCAAGTGKFLEMIAKQFDITLDELGQLSATSSEKTPISNICAVFAQSEIVNLISKGECSSDIVKAAEISIVSRIYGMADRMGIRDDIMFCGGVARNAGMVNTLKERLQRDVFVPDNPDYVGAYGASLFAVKAAKKAAITN